LLGIAMLVLAIRGYRREKQGVLWATVVSALMYAAQAGLGAAVVITDTRRPELVTLHLGMAMLLLAGLLAAGVIAWYRPGRQYVRDNFTVLGYVTTALALVIILTGALVRGSGATLAC